MPNTEQMVMYPKYYSRWVGNAWFTEWDGTLTKVMVFKLTSNVDLQYEAYCLPGDPHDYVRIQYMDDGVSNVVHKRYFDAHASMFNSFDYNGR